MTGIGMADLIRSKPDRDDMKATPMSEFVDIVDVLSRKLGEIYGTKNKIKAIELAIPIQLQEGDNVRQLDEISTAYSLIKVRSGEQEVKIVKDEKVMKENEQLKDELDRMSIKIEELEADNYELDLEIQKKSKAKVIVRRAVKEEVIKPVKNQDKIRQKIREIQKMNKGSLSWERKVFYDKLEMALSQLLYLL